LLFMATGCVSCVADVNGLRQAMAAHPGIQAVGVDTVAADSPRQLGSFLEDQGLADAPLLWVIDRDGSIVSRYGVAALGATVGIDRSGTVRFTNPGPSGAAHLAAQLALLTA
jgi:peroxiredoxin